MLGALGFLLIFGFGYTITLLLAPHSKPFERVGLAYGLGLGWLTFIMFLLSWARVSLGVSTVAAAIALPAVFLLLYKRRALPLTIPSHLKVALTVFKRARSLRVGQTILVLALLLFITSSAVVATYWPVYSWDALSLFDFRGRVLFPELGVRGLKEAYYAHYPFLTSLGHTWLYRMGAANPKLMYPLFYLSLLLGFCGCLKRECPSLLSLAWSTVLVCTPIVYRQSTIAYTNLPFTFYYGLGTIYLCQWFSSRKRDSLVLSAVLLALSLWTRPASEVLVFVNFTVVVAFCLSKRDWVDPFVFVLPVLLIYLPWILYQKYGLAELSIGEIYPAFASIRNVSWSRLAVLLKSFARYVVDLRLFGLSWVLFFLTAPVDKRSLGEHRNLLAMIFLGILAWFGMLSVAYVGPEKSYEVFIGQSGSRLLLSFVPVILYYSAVSRAARFGWLLGTGKGLGREDQAARG